EHALLQQHIERTAAHVFDDETGEDDAEIAVHGPRSGLVCERHGGNATAVGVAALELAPERCVRCKAGVVQHQVAYRHGLTGRTAAPFRDELRDGIIERDESIVDKHHECGRRCDDLGHGCEIVER